MPPTVGELERQVRAVETELREWRTTALDFREKVVVAQAQIRDRLEHHSAQHAETIQILRGSGGINGKGGMIAELRSIAQDVERLEADAKRISDALSGEKKVGAQVAYQRWRVVLLILALLGAYVLPSILQQAPDKDFLKEILREVRAENPVPAPVPFKD